MPGGKHVRGICSSVDLFEQRFKKVRFRLSGVMQMATQSDAGPQNEKRCLLSLPDSDRLFEDGATRLTHGLGQ